MVIFKKDGDKMERNEMGRKNCKKEEEGWRKEHYGNITCKALMGSTGGMHMM